MTETTPKKGNGREWIIGLLAILLAISTGFNVRCYYLNDYKTDLIDLEMKVLKLETGSIGKPEPHAALKAKIASYLADPESVRWGSFKAIDEDTACGELNAKNRAGGYSGMTPFIFSTRGVGCCGPLRLWSDPRLTTSYPDLQRKFTDEFIALQKFYCTLPATPTAPTATPGQWVNK